MDGTQGLAASENDIERTAPDTAAHAARTAAAHAARPTHHPDGRLTSKGIHDKLVQEYAEQAYRRGEGEHTNPYAAGTHDAEVWHASWEREAKRSAP